MVLHATVLIIIFSSCLAFPPASIRSRTNTILLQDLSGRTSESDATAASHLQSDSSYEALRRKFGLIDDPNVKDEDPTLATKYDTNKNESDHSENVDATTLDDATQTHIELNPLLSNSSEYSPKIETKVSNPDTTTVYSRTFPR